MEVFDPDLIEKFENWIVSEEDTTDKLVELLAPEIPSKRARKATVLCLLSDNYSTDLLSRPFVHTLLIGESIPNKIIRWLGQNIESLVDCPTYDSNIKSEQIIEEINKKGNEIATVRNLEQHSNNFYSNFENVMANSKCKSTMSTKQCKIIASARNSTKIPGRILEEFDLIVRIKNVNKEEQLDASKQVINSFGTNYDGSNNSSNNNVRSKLNHYLRWVKRYHPIFNSEETKNDINKINKKLAASKSKNFHQIYKSHFRIAVAIAKSNKSDLTTNHYYQAIAFKQNKSVEKIKRKYNHEENIEFSPTRNYIDNSSDIISQLVDLGDQQFEELVSKIWEVRGWNTHLTPKQDRGIDIVAEKYEPFHQKQLIQVKKYGNTKVSSEEVQQYAALKLQQRDADMVVVVTTGEFSKNAQDLAEQLNVKLVNGTSLTNIINDIGYTDKII